MSSQGGRRGHGRTWLNPAGRRYDGPGESEVASVPFRVTPGSDRSQLTRAPVPKNQTLRSEPGRAQTSRARTNIRARRRQRLPPALRVWLLVASDAREHRRRFANPATYNPALPVGR